MSRRRQPPLFEFLGAPDRRTTVEADGNAMGRRPVEVPIPSRAPSANSRSGISGVFGAAKPAIGSTRAGGSGGSGGLRLTLPVIALIGGGLLVAVLVIYSLAFRLGQHEKEQQLAPHLTEQQSPRQTLPESGTQAGIAGGGSGVVGTSGIPGAQTNADESPTGAMPAATDVRQAGTNYLELCTLMYKDGEAAVQYLAKSGVRAALAPTGKGVDPASARDKNQPHLLFVAEGVPSERFKASERDRKALETRVEQIGKRWQREEHGASDFARPMWRLYKGRE